jgi:hypothetical protein
MMEQVDLLTIYPVIANLTKDCLKALLFCKKDKAYNINSVLQEIGKPVTRLVLLTKGEIAIYCKRSAIPQAEKITLDDTDPQEIPNPCSIIKPEPIFKKFSQIKTVVGPAILFEEYYLLRRPSIFRSVVISETCETIEFDFGDLSKCINMSPIDQETINEASKSKILRQALIQQNRARIDRSLHTRVADGHDRHRHEAICLSVYRKHGAVVAANRLIK